MDDICKILAKKVKEKGGRAYFVGGYVRDKLLGINSKDIDIEVHGIKPNDLKAILDSIGKPLEYGKSFGIYSLKGKNIDVAMPRSETSYGIGHKDFNIEVDPYIGTYKAALRRDFTINALMMDILTNEVIDHFNGQLDLKNKVIRHVNDDTFSEDPLRVLRALQFAARFNFKITDATIKLCQSIDITTLSKERVYLELEKALIQSNKPSIFFKEMKKMNKGSYWFKELFALDNESIEKIYINIDNASSYINKTMKYMLLILCMDVSSAEIFIKRLTNNKDVLNYILNMKEIILSINDDLSVYETNVLFDKAIDIDDILYYFKDNSFIKERHNEYLKVKDLDYVKGKDLIDIGFTPNDTFKEILDYAYSLKLKGLSKTKVLDKIKTKL